MNPTTELLPPVPSGPLEELVRRSDWKRYRNYRVVSRARQGAVILEELGPASGDLVRLMVPGQAGSACAAGIVAENDFETDLFGIRMGCVRTLIHEPGNRAALRALVFDMLGQTDALGVDHLSARIDAGNLECIRVLEDAGFRMVDSLVTYAYLPRWEPPPPVRSLGTVREIRESDHDTIVELTAEAYRGFRGRYHQDPKLPDAIADRVYVEWARRLCTGEWSDRVFVAEASDGSVAGYMGFRRIEPISRIAGVPIYGGGLGACRPDRVGAYRGLLYTGTVWAHDRGGVAETQTQASNAPAVRLYESIGLRLVSVDHSFHRWAPHASAATGGASPWR